MTIDDLADGFERLFQPRSVRHARATFASVLGEFNDRESGIDLARNHSDFTCQDCGGAFRADRSSHAKRCSRCRQVDRRRRDSARVETPYRKACTRCGALFRRPSRRRLYCGKCRIERDRELNRGDYRGSSTAAPPIQCCDCPAIVPNLGGDRKRCVPCQRRYRHSYAYRRDLAKRKQEVSA